MKLNASVMCLVSALVSASALADDWEFVAELTGDQQVPPVETETNGETKLEVNADMTRIDFELEIENAAGILEGPGGHLHCAPADQNGPVIAFLAGGLPQGSGFIGDVEVEATLYDGNIKPTACGTTVSEVVNSMLAGDVYVNIHSAANPGGEIRGQVVLDSD
jgi:hypothetical protein